jgi:nicotinamidase-related amidase
MGNIFACIIKQLYFMNLVSILSQNQNKKALIVIDVQENLLKPDSRLHVEKSAVPSLLESLNRSIAAFRESNYPVIYTINEWTNPILNFLTGNVCKKGSKGTGIDTRVTIVGDKIYHKSRSNALSIREILQFLKAEGIVELYISGIFAEHCVKGTQVGATKHKFKTIIIEDAVASGSVKNKLKAIKYCESNGARLIRSNNLSI